MAKRCRQLCIVLFVTLWFIIAEGSFCKLVHAELLQEKSEESDFAEDMDEALSELDLSDLEQFVSDNLSKTHDRFGELVRNLIHADRPISFFKVFIRYRVSFNWRGAGKSYTGSFYFAACGLLCSS